ncbi:MAG: tetratricopeptide repeat protein, partial [Fibrobacterota bacterium]
PRNREYLRRLATCHEQAGDLVRARDTWRTLYTLAPSDAGSRDRLRALYRLLRDEDALKALLESEPARTAADDNAFMDLRNLYAAERDSAGLFRLYTARLRTRPNDRFLLDDFGRVALFFGRPDRAARLMTDFLDRGHDADFDDRLRFTLRFYDGNGRSDSAASLLDRLIRLGRTDDPDSRKELGRRWVALDRLDLAIAAYEAHLKQHPSDLEAETALATLYAWNKQGAAELSLLERQYPKRKNDPAYLRLLAERYTWADSADRALACYERLDSLAPTHGNEEKLIALYRGRNLSARLIAWLERYRARTGEFALSARVALLAESYAAAGERNRAVALYRRLSQDDNANPGWLLRIAELYNGSGAIDSAVIYYEKARARTPLDSTAAMLLGEYYFWKGADDRAFACFMEAQKAAPGNRKIRFYLGELLFKRGDMKKALPLLKDAYEWMKVQDPRSRDRELFFVVCGRLNRTDDLVREVYRVDFREARFRDYFTSVIYGLFRNNDYASANELLDFYESGRNPVTPALTRVLTDEAALLKSKGRWDMARKLMARCETH